MSHDSWLIQPLMLIHNSWIIPPTPILTLFFSALSVGNHESWVTSPESSYLYFFLAEDGHTIALINPWKFHWDWSSHLWVYKRFATGFLMFLAPTNYAPVGAWLYYKYQIFKSIKAEFHDQARR